MDGVAVISFATGSGSDTAKPVVFWPNQPNERTRAPCSAPSSSNTRRRPDTVGMATPYTGSSGTCKKAHVKAASTHQSCACQTRLPERSTEERACRKLGAPSSSGSNFLFWQPAHRRGRCCFTSVLDHFRNQAGACWHTEVSAAA